jgi:hypothetical protein
MHIIKKKPIGQDEMAACSINNSQVKHYFAADLARKAV